MLAADPLGAAPLGAAPLGAAPLGAGVTDTAEFMLGRVAVTPVFFESTGAASTQDWTEQEIDGVLQKVRDAMQWWVDTLDGLGSVHTLEFVYDESFARTPFETTYEPIDQISNAHGNYLAEFLTARQMDSRLSLQDAVRVFNHQQRLAMDADWGVTLLIVDASDDPDGAFAPGGSFNTAFAYAGGAYMVVPSTRPASVITHEMGHLFWTQDEYTGGDSWSEHRGYYDTLNLNAADNPDPDFVQEISIMAGGTYRSYAYQQHVSPASTLALVGWQDSDGDGVFDVLDVPLALEGVGRFDAENQRLEFRGEARAVALPNRNPEGSGNDITLNRISRVEYRIDDGPWQTAVAPDRQVAEVAFDVAVPATFTTVDIRAIDAATGVTSPSITVTPLIPGTAPASATGYVYLDQNTDGLPDADEAAIGDVVAEVVAATAGELPVVASVDAQSVASGQVLEDLAGWQIRGTAAKSDGRVVFEGDSGEVGGPRLKWYDVTQGEWNDRWSPYDHLEVRPEENTTQVQVTVVAPAAGARGRLEAYDAAGNLLDRETSPALASGATATLTVADPGNQIASVRLFGHEGTEVLVNRVRLGPQLSAHSDASGLLRFENLPAGRYQVQFDLPLVIHQSLGTQEITVGDSQPTATWGVQRGASPWQNSQVATDVDRSDGVEPIDALMVINYLNRHGTGPLPAFTAGAPLIDVDGDGIVAPVDALLVVNELNRLSRQGGQSAVQREAASGEAADQALQAGGWVAASLEAEAPDRFRRDETRSISAAEATDRVLADPGANVFSPPDMSMNRPPAGGLHGYSGPEDGDTTKPEDPVDAFFLEPLRSDGF